MIINKKCLLAALLLSLSVSTAVFAAAPNNFSVKADELEYNLQTGEGEAKGHVVLKQDGGVATANYAKFNSKAKTGTLTGNVMADRDDAHIVCNVFMAHNENDMSAIGNAVVTKDGKSLSADRIDYYKERQFAETIGSWAKLTDVDGSVMNASKIDYDMAKGVANAYGGVTIDSKARTLTAKADSAIYKTDQSGYVELNGNATATQNGNTVSGDKLRLTNANVAVADGNVKVHYVPEKQPAVPGKKEQTEEVKVAEAAKEANGSSDAKATKATVAAAEARA